MSSIPFQLPDDGLNEIKGVVYLDEEFLVIEIETALLGEFDKEQQVVKVEPSALRDIRLDTGVFRDRLCLQPKTQALLEAVPGKHLGEVQLRIWRTHRERVERLVEEVRARREQKGAA